MAPFNLDVCNIFFDFLATLILNWKEDGQMYQKDIDEDENENLSAADCGRQGMLRLGRAEDRSAIDGRGTAR